MKKSSSVICSLALLFTGLLSVPLSFKAAHAYTYRAAMQSGSTDQDSIVVVGIAVLFSSCAGLAVALAAGWWFASIVIGTNKRMR